MAIPSQITRDDVLCGQINLHRSMLGASSLMAHLSTKVQTPPPPTPTVIPSRNLVDRHGKTAQDKSSSFLVSLQEPPTRNNKIVGIGGGHSIFYHNTNDERPRAAIIASQTKLFISKVCLSLPFPPSLVYPRARARRERQMNGN